MPKLRPLTDLDRVKETERARHERIVRIINCAASAKGYDRRQLAAAAGIEYQTLNKRMREGTFRMMEIARVADALQMDIQTRAALLAAPEKCRYEIGYKGAAS